MKIKAFAWMVGLALWLGGMAMGAQNSISISLSPAGLLTCTNLKPFSYATLQTATGRLSGDGYPDWQYVPAFAWHFADANGNSTFDVGPLTSKVPVFYRVQGTPMPITPTNMVLIPEGSFTMGDVNDNNSFGLPDASPVSVYVSDFYMDKYDVTLGLWQQVYDWATNHGYSFDEPGAGKGTDHPVVGLNWYDCVKWCNARSEMAGEVPAYYTDATQTTVYRTGSNDLANESVNWSAGYRLPTEAEWEKAARGGVSGWRYPGGNTISESQANYYSSAYLSAYGDLSATGNNPVYATGAGPWTSPVGSFAPNGYGLYDMAGNVFQWCWDWYGTPYANYSGDPHGPGSGSGPDGYSFRVSRGGAYAFNCGACRCANRRYDDPYLSGNAPYINYIGFRTAHP